ncbi:muramidase [Aromatoleum buckelii]|uniref:muramidase n=1 Tax=Aromatoleum buckelii TaxID=200254 RepID=UPI001FF217ED|nr:muramidase [Aromatoleum buckelii]MCK0509585.1 muramidase [Aromatoleum buckelii]
MPFVADLPPLEQERIVCSVSSAVKYEVPANIVLAVAEKEGGKPGQWVRNTNGTHDVGPMQFNTAYLRELERYGITANDVAAAGCYSFDLAAWRLRMHLHNDKGDIWTRAANYHSRTPQFNAIYRADLMEKAGKWADWLEARFVTLDVTKEGVAAPSTPTMQAPVAAAAATQAAQPTLPRSTRPCAYLPRQITFTSAANE